MESAAAAQLNPPFKVSVVSQPSSQPQGTVLRQSPAANSNLASGSTVTLYVSTGHPPMVTVPRETGMTRKAAVAALKKLGFNVTVVLEQTTDNKQVGKVMSESPTEGTSVPKGSTVTIMVGEQVTSTTTSTSTTGTSTLPGV
jgi:serine/threonine-protein kinase